MTLATFDLLARVISARPATLRGFHALAVDHASAGRSLPASGQTHGHNQRMVDRAPKPAVTPSVEIALHCRDRREVSRQHPPRQSAAQHVEQSIHDRPSRPLGRFPAPPISASVKSLEYRRLLRACLARVISVHMWRSVDVSQHRLNHKSLISPNFFSGQTLRATRTAEKAFYPSTQ